MEDIRNVWLARPLRAPSRIDRRREVTQVELDWCRAVAAVVREFGGRFRFKLRGEVEAEPWGCWLTAPARGYLENDASGPYSVRDLEWVEVEPGGAGPAALADSLAAAGVASAVVRHAVRVGAPNAC